MSAWRERLRRAVASDIVVLAGLLALAAVLRLPDLAARGPWDTDQGDQMLAIRNIARGTLTLLGPSTSTGGIHHGPVFFYLGALLSLPSGGNDPVAVTLGIAIGGIVAVGAIWWLARRIAGPVAGLVAGLLAAVSAQMIDASLRLWNPAFVAPAAALALAAAWEAYRRRDPRWWAPAAIAFVLAAQSHILAWVLTAPIALLAALDLRAHGRRVLPWLGVAAGIVALSLVPLAIHEAITGFGELRAALASAAATGDPGPSLAARTPFVPLRVISVPLVGQVLLSLPATVTAFAVVVGAAVIACRRGPQAPAARWLTAGLVLGIAGLVIGAPWLATVTPLYVDHYHLALDPIVFVLMGIAAGVLWGGGRAPRAAVAIVVVAIVAWNLVVVRLPMVNPDGGWPAGLTAGRRVAAAVGGEPAALVGSPPFKLNTAVSYVLTVLGKAPVDTPAATDVAVLCDDLFRDVVKARCQGPAEANALAAAGLTAGQLVDRFEAAPGRWISVFRLAGR